MLILMTGALKFPMPGLKLLLDHIQAPLPQVSVYRVISPVSYMLATVIH